MSAARRRPRGRAALVAITTGAMLLPAPPSSGQEGVSLEAPEQEPPDPFPQALPASRRVPVPAELDEDGMRNPPRADIRLRAGATPEEPVPGARALPRKGGHFSVPVRRAYGQVRGGAFISQENNWTPRGFLGGDDRGFSFKAPADRFRIYMLIDYQRGFGTVRINPTCNGARKDCTSARDVVLGRHLDVRVARDGSVGLNIAVQNSKFGAPFYPHINAGVFIRPRPRSNEVDGLVFGDAYPAWELYQSTARHRRTLLQDTGTWAGPIGGLGGFLTRFERF